MTTLDRAGPDDAPLEIATLDIGVLDTVGEADAVARLAPLFEGAPRFLARLAGARPFGTWAALFDAARAIAHAMPEAEQIELIDAHPRLGAPPATVSALSYREQGYDREAAERAAGAAEEERLRVAAELSRLNEAYETVMGFRYCVFVAGRPRAALLPDMAAAVARSREAELERALDAVVDIAMARRAALETKGT